MMFQFLSLAILSMISGLLSGCTASPPVSYYTLSVETEAGLPGTDIERSNLTMSVDHISLPEVVDRPQMVLQSGSNQVRLVDDHRWAESLKSEIPRVIARNLSQLLMAEMVWSYPQIPKGPVDYRIFIDVQRFESTQGSAVAIDALWTIQGPSTDGTDLKTGRSTFQQPITGQGYAAIAEAHSRGLAAISREIAEAIRNTMEQKPADATPG